jgi:hypothetical protein
MTEQDNHPDPYAPVWGEQNPADDTRVIRPIAAQNVIQPGQEIRYRDGKAEVVWSDPQAPPLWHTAAAYGAPRQPMPARRPPEGYGPPPELRDLQAQNPEIDLSAVSKPKRRRWVPWLIGALVVMVAGCVLGIAGLGLLAGSEPDGAPPIGESSAAPVAGKVAPTKAAERGTRANPYRAGQRFTLPEWEASLGKTTSGAAAVRAVTKANTFNEKPKAGNTFVMVKATVKHTEGDPMMPWLGISMGFLGKNGVVYGKGSADSYCGVEPAPALDDAGELYPGASASGNVCVQVPTSQVAGGVWTVESLFRADERRFVAQK